MISVTDKARPEKAAGPAIPATTSTMPGAAGGSCAQALQCTPRNSTCLALACPALSSPSHGRWPAWRGSGGLRRALKTLELKTSSIKVRPSFGLWLHYGGKLEHFLPAEFRQTVSAVLEVTDEYIGISSHGPSFFPTANVDPAYIEARRGIRG
jgi:hypothetical protein